MLTRAQLLARHCRPLEGSSALSDSEVHRQLTVLDGWGLRESRIVKTYRFANYFETLAFVNALADMIHREDHHPELVIGYNRCEVRFDTHSVGGVSENDFICAAKTDAIFDRQFGTAA